MDRFNISGNGSEDRFIGNSGRLDSEFDNTLSDNAEWQTPHRSINWWRVLGLIICIVPWGLIATALYAHYHFRLHSH